MVKFIVGLALITIAFWGCKDEMNKTGYDLLLPGDLVSAHKDTIDKATIKAFTVRDEKLRTNKPTFNMLGTFVDPVFGKTTADFAAQLRIHAYHDFTNATFDSLNFTLVYMEKYGDSVTPQNFKLYELQSDLDGDDTTLYYQDIDLKGMAKSEVLAEVNHVPKFQIYYDSINPNVGSTKETPKDTAIQEIRFNLGAALAQKLMAADSMQRSDNDEFLKYFKGLYVEAGDLNQGGAIMRVKTLASGSAMRLYYHKPNDTTKYVVEYWMNSSAARTSRFVHDYSTTAFAANLDQMNQQDTLIYLQTTGGLSSKILIPGLSGWKDSTDVAINKAELIFDIEKAYIDTVMFPPTPKLILSLIDKDGKIFDTKNQLIFPSDLSFSEAYYGGTYNEEDGTYRFNLAKHLQDITKGKTENYGFYLTTDNKNAIFNRAVLKGATSKKGIRFEITYSKIK